MQHRWRVTSSNQTSIAINANMGRPCRVRLRTKWFKEEDWVDHDLWMVPGWKPEDIWKEAYSWISEQNMWYKDLVGEEPTVEEARLDDFKLV